MQMEKAVIVGLTTFERKRLFVLLCVATVIVGVVYLGALYGLGAHSEPAGLSRAGAANGIVAGTSLTAGPCSPLDSDGKVACTWSMLTSRLGNPDKYAERSSASSNVCPVYNNSGHP